MALRIAKVLVLCVLVSYGQCILIRLALQAFINFYVLHIENVSPTCYRQLSELRDNLQQQGPELWGLKMLDATSKIQSGTMSLNIGGMGNFEQCINTEGTLSTGEKVTGKYCLGHLHLYPLPEKGDFKELNERIYDQVLSQLQASAINNVAVPKNTSLGPTWAACFPDGCSTADILTVVNKKIQIIVNATAIIFDDEYCQTKKDVNSGLTWGAITIIVILSFYLAFLCGCTVYDIVRQRLNIGNFPILVAFSMYSNSKELFQINKNSDYKPCLDGLKVLGILWVVLAHQYSITCSGPITNTMGLIQWADTFRSKFIVSSTLSTDTFLVISAFLLTTRILKERSENTPTRGCRLWLQRYIRLAPALVIMVLVSSTLLTHLGSGPRWPSVKLYFQDKCVSYWWSTLLFVQNYFTGQDMCIAQSWYLSIDMQLFTISLPILIYLYSKNKSVGFVATSGVFLSVVLSFIIAWAYGLSPFLTNLHGDVESYYSHYYILTHTRAAPWFMGILCGNLVHMYEKKNLPQRAMTIIKKWAPLIWLSCVVILVGCMFASGHSGPREPTSYIWMNVLHIVMVRPAWALAICWIIFACVTDTGKISEKVDYILGNSYFQIMRRFVYSLFLVHVTTMYLILYERKTPKFFSDFAMIYEFCGSLAFNWILAFVWVVAFESPFINLEKEFREIRVQQIPIADEQSPVVSGSREPVPSPSHEEEIPMYEINLSKEEVSKEEEKPPVPGCSRQEKNAMVEIDLNKEQVSKGED